MRIPDKKLTVDGGFKMNYKNKLLFLTSVVLFLLWGGFLLPSVVVSNASELAAAVYNANSGGDKEIILTNGTYTLNDALGIWADGVIVRSQTGKRGKVIIRGQGMYGGVTHIFNVAGTNFTARDMTIGWVSNHAIQIWGNNNSSNTFISNLRIVDTYEQMVKISYDSLSPNSSENGIMEYCLLEYSAGIGPQYYIGGIDGHQCKNWTVRNNVFKNIRSPSGDVAEHAIHFWSDSVGTLVENNVIINCDRGIGFGLGSRGHSGGIIRNNMIYHNSSEGFADVGIGLENAANAWVYNNTIFMEHSYPNAIEYRFPGTKGGIIKNNICSRAITSRDGGSADVANNVTTRAANWFVDASSGDLHLVSPIPQAVDQGVIIPGLNTDIDGDSRPQGRGIDLGADEYVVATPDSISVTSPNGGETWNLGSTYIITWTSTGSVGNVKIQFSKDSAATWTILTHSTTNDGAYSWTIPDNAYMVSSSCLVRISEAYDGIPSDTSNAVFSIFDTPEISLSHSRFIFGASTSGVTTDPQSFYISVSGQGTLNWTVSDNVGWLICSPTSGTGPGAVVVSVTPSGLSGLSPGTYTGTISVSDAGNSASTQTIAVTLNLYAAGSDSMPFGSFDTPLDGSTVRSSIPVTGWVLDDIGVEDVKIYRAPVPGEGKGLIYIGDGVLVTGARTDIEQAYPGYPLNDTAGWGYMMLTNFLPNSGNGTFMLYAIARDGTGNEATLGIKTITCDNANAVKPFGAIDTPAQGGAASGNNFINWGWVLTPQPNSIPTNGSTINVYVDGVYLGHPIYNIYRPDIASLFPGYANSNGAAGYFYLDTTAYENGVHTIQWTATDNAGNIDGIGSRYFTIQNAGNSSKLMSRGQGGLPPCFKDSGQALLFQKPDSLPPVGTSLDEPIYLRKGYNENVRPQRIYPGKDGMINIDINQMERIEINLGQPGLRGFHIVGDQSRPLPVGSKLDREKGIFYWQTGVGFTGLHRLLFMDTTKNRLVKINIKIVPLFSP
jgi:hypothetical protein